MTTILAQRGATFKLLKKISMNFNWNWRRYHQNLQRQQSFICKMVCKMIGAIFFEYIHFSKTPLALLLFFYFQLSFFWRMLAMLVNNMTSCFCFLSKLMTNLSSPKNPSPEGSLWLEAQFQGWKERHTLNIQLAVYHYTQQKFDKLFNQFPNKSVGVWI